jgi:DNA repair exonuclease SbcCD ATPase subunit
MSNPMYDRLNKDNIKKDEPKEGIKITDFRRWCDLFLNTKEKMKIQKDVVYRQLAPLDTALIKDPDDGGEDKLNILRVNIKNDYFLAGLDVGKEIIVTLDESKKMLELQNYYFKNLEIYIQSFVDLCENAENMIEEYMSRSSSYKEELEEKRDLIKSTDNIHLKEINELKENKRSNESQILDFKKNIETYQNEIKNKSVEIEDLKQQIEINQKIMDQGNVESISKEIYDNIEDYNDFKIAIKDKGSIGHILPKKVRDILVEINGKEKKFDKETQEKIKPEQEKSNDRQPEEKVYNKKCQVCNIEFVTDKAKKRLCEKCAKDKERESKRKYEKIKRQDNKNLENEAEDNQNSNKNIVKVSR